MHYTPRMPEFLVQTEAILTMDPPRPVGPGGMVLVQDGVIKKVVEPTAAEAFDPDYPRVDLSSCVAIPGFVQTHLHTCQTLFRGLADDRDLLHWLREKIFPLEAAHDARSLRASSRLALWELSRSGTTTFMDMGTVRHTDVLAREIDASGLRAFFGKALMDTNPGCPELSEPTDAAMRGAMELAQAYHGTAGGRLRFAFTPRFVLACTDRLLRESFEAMADFGHSRWHSHASESPGEMQEVRSRCGCGNVEHLDRLGTLSTESCLAHCVHLEPSEIDILARTGTHVLHCPSSNLKLASGIADVPALVGRGISVSLGCDGAACSNALDMFTEMRLAALIQKPRHGPEAMPARQVLEMATLGGARALGWEDEIGSLEPGKAADVVFVDLNRAWNPVSPGTEAEYAGAIVYSARPENVKAVLASGEWVVREGRVLRLDELEVRTRAREELVSLRRRAGV